MNKSAGPLSIKLFGAFEASLNGRPLPELRLRSGEPLLAFLALHPDQALRATWLAQIFWKEQALVEGEMDRALASLRQSAHHLRQTLAEEGARLEATNKMVLFRGEGVCVDALTFEQTLTQGDTASLECAAALYKGPLL